MEQNIMLLGREIIARIYRNFLMHRVRYIPDMKLTFFQQEKIANQEHDSWNILSEMYLGICNY